MTITKRRNKHEVYVRVNGKNIYGGMFSLPFDAYIKQAELKVKQKSYGAKPPTQEKGIVRSQQILSIGWK